MTGVIRPLIWEISDSTFGAFCDYTVFELPVDLYDTLVDAFRKDHDRFRSLPQKSLEQLIGWFAPDVGFVKCEESFRSRKYTLHIYYLGKCEKRCAANDLSNAFQLWLSVSAPKNHDPQLDDRLVKDAEDANNWFSRQLDFGFNTAPDRCIEPHDPKTFDIIAQGIAVYLSHHPVMLDGKNCGELILSGIKGNPFYGRELFLFPPERVPGQDRDVYWSEFIKISTMTAPEAQRMRIVASVHVRNYGPLTAKSRSSSDRNLDVFFPAKKIAGNGAKLRHGKIPFHLEGRNDGDVRPVYGYRNGDDLFKVITTFSGSAKVDSSRVPFEPIAGDAGLWILPRLGRGFGDRRLAAGQGTSWTDRQAFASYLDGVFARIGLNPVEGLERVAPNRGFSITYPWTDPSEPREKTPTKLAKFQDDLQLTQARRRGATAKTLASGPLRIAFFRLRDNAPDQLREGIISLFGSPVRETSEILQFDKLTIHLKVAKTGILGEPLPDRPQIDPTVAARMNKSKHEDIVRSQHRSLLDEREEQLRTYIDKVTAQWRGTDPWIALIEMPENLRDRVHDPYVRVYRSVTAMGGVPQALLVDTLGHANEFKVPQGLRDGLRMLGVTGFDEIKVRSKKPIPKDIRLVGLWIVRRNEEFKAGERRDSCAFPLAIMHDVDSLKVALPNPDRRGWKWMSYGSACVCIRTRQVPSYSGMRRAQCEDMFSQFYREIIESLLIDGKETLVMAEAGNIRNEVPAMKNHHLNLGIWEIEGLPGQITLKVPDSKTSLSIVRVNSVDSKRASYCRYGVRGNVVGAFRESGRMRTFWAVRPPAHSMTGNWDLKSAMLASRRGVSHPHHVLRKSDVEYFDEDRAAPGLEEIVVLARSKTLSSETLVSLVRKLQLAHVAWDSATVLPYPLHEGSLLEKIVG